MKVGVLLDEAKIPVGFDYVFFEVKPSSGRIHVPLKGAWNVVNCFADNTISQARPELVATCKGERAVRGTPRRFLWDWICPSRTEYRKYCKKTVGDLVAQVEGIRLDSVCFPREGYCDCKVCTELQAKSGMGWPEWRAFQIESFVKEIRELVPENLGLTLEPDPCYGKERFGLDIAALEKCVDFFSIPLYMDYSIAYWVDIIANCFRRKISKPLFIEIYASHPKQSTKNIASALAVASAYADCLVLSTYEAKEAVRLQRDLAGNSDVLAFLRDRNCQPVLDILARWSKLG